MVAQRDPASLPDMDSRDRVEQFVDMFYGRVLADPELAPIFIDVAAIDLDVHLPHIKDYWCKLLLGESSYKRHTMNIHRQLHNKQELNPALFDRWLSLFLASIDENFAGPRADRARQVARSIAGNMQAALLSIPE